MPRTSTRETSHLPSLLLGGAGIALAFPFVHDALDRRLLTAESIFSSPLTALLSILGVGMAGIILWDFFSSRWPR